MKLQVPFIQLPLAFDADRLAAEMHALGPNAWREHPSKYPGNYSLPLIAVGGDPESDEVSGPMRPTEWLERCPYLTQVLARIGAVWGRTRLMKLAGGAEVTPHVDINYYWREHMRVHVPITTRPGVRFICGEAEVNMRAGECWIFDTWRPHRVINVPGHERVHLVADTIGGDRFWEIASRGRVPGQREPEGWRAESFGSEDSTLAQLLIERRNVPGVMTPWELREHVQFLLSHVRPDPRLASIQQAGTRFATSWHALWARFGDDAEGWPHYRVLLEGFDAWMRAQGDGLQLANGMGLVTTWTAMIGKAALGEQARVATSTSNRAGVAPETHPARATHGFVRSVFIVSPPRSGSTLLFETLAQAPDVYTIGGESHRMIEVEVANGALGTITRGYSSNRLEANDVTPEIADELRGRYYAAAFDRDGRRPEGAIRLLEKTPKNALRLPFLANIFPDARFVYLYREPREVLASMLEAWESGRFRTYPDLPGWTGLPWSMVLIPGWRDLIGKPLAGIVAAQWETTTRILLDDFERLPSDRRIAVRHDTFVANPDVEIRKLSAKLGLGWDRELDAQLPHARYTVSAPRPDKWRVREAEIQPCLERLAETQARCERVVAENGLG